MLNFGNREFRNLQEQVEKNAADILKLNYGGAVLSEFGIRVVGQLENEEDLPDPSFFEEKDVGNAYAIGAEPPYELFVLTRPFVEGDPLQWFNIGRFPEPGPQGEPGEDGAVGPQGPRGSSTTAGIGTPIISSNYILNDVYIDSTNGNVYSFNGTQWTFRGSIRGPQGLQGERGPQGIQGLQGEQGIQGPQGNPGNSFNILGQVSSVSQLPDPDDVSDGSAMLVGSAAPYHMYVLITNPTRSWLDAGTFNATDIVELTGTSGTLNADQYNKLTSSPSVLIKLGSEDILRLNNETNSVLVYNMVDRYNVDHPMEKYIVINKISLAWTLTSEKLILDSDLEDYATNYDLTQGLAGKQATLVNTVNIKSINGTSLLGSGNITIETGASEWGEITGTLANQTDLQNALDAKADVEDIPSLDGYATEDYVDGKIADVEAEIPDVTGFATKTELNTGLAQKQAVISDLDDIRSGAELGATALQSVPDTYRTSAAQDVIDAGKASIDSLADVAFSGDYDDLSNKPTIPVVPTNVSAFTNDAGYITEDDIPDVPVTKVNNKTGNVVLTASDINASNSQSIQNNLERIDSEINRVEGEIPDISDLASTDYVDGKVSDLEDAIDEKQDALGYTAENAANKVSTISDDSATQYASVTAIKNFVNSSISSSTATFRGNFATYALLEAYAGDKHNNDYAVVSADETHSGQTSRYKYNGTSWVYEYKVNDAPFSQSQMNAINSGIDSTKVAAFEAYEDDKQDVISDLATIRSGAALGATAVQPVAGKGLFSGNYNDLTNKPTIPSIEGLATEQYVDSAVTGLATETYVDNAVTGLVTTSELEYAIEEVEAEIPDVSELVSQSQLATYLNTKQDILTAGTGISISNNVISSTVNSATWGNITGTLANQTDLQNALNNKLSKDIYVDVEVHGKEIYASGNNGYFKGKIKTNTIDCGMNGNLSIIYGHSDDTTETNYIVLNNKNWSGVATNSKFLRLTFDTTNASSHDYDSNIITIPNKTGTLATLDDVGSSYTAGSGINISNNTISADTTVLATKTDISGKQDTSTAYNKSNIVFGTSEPSNPTLGMIWLEPVE